ncbi:MULTISPECIES: hypothetical protein [unclassified Brevundimonas]
MTTPRVTVPVELAERIKSFLLQAREDRKNSGRTKQALEINAMLHGLITAPAAPAPEGGAVEQHVEQLRHPEGSAVTVLSDNPHLNGQPNSSSFLAGGSASPAKAGCAAHAAAVLASQGGPR